MGVPISECKLYGVDEAPYHSQTLSSSAGLHSDDRMSTPAYYQHIHSDQLQRRNLLDELHAGSDVYDSKYEVCQPTLYTSRPVTLAHRPDGVVYQPLRPPPTFKPPPLPTEEQHYASTSEYGDSNNDESTVMTSATPPGAHSDHSNDSGVGNSGAQRNSSYKYDCELLNTVFL